MPRGAFLENRKLGYSSEFRTVKVKAAANRETGRREERTRRSRGEKKCVRLGAGTFQRNVGGKSGLHLLFQEEKNNEPLSSSRIRDYGGNRYRGQGR